VVQLLYRLLDDGISAADDWSIHLQDGTSNHLLVGFTLIVCYGAQSVSNMRHTNNNRHLLQFCL
jgi:hypothetical protein